MVYGQRALQTLVDRTNVREEVADIELHSYLSRQPQDVNPMLRDTIHCSVRLKQGTGKITYASLVAETRSIPKTELESPDEVYRLAKEYGGNDHLRIMLREYEPSINYSGVDLSFYNWGENSIFKMFTCNGNPRFPERIKRTYEARGMLQKIFEIFGIEHVIDTQEQRVIAYEDQQRMRCTPEGIKNAYELLLETGYVPSIANGGAESGFHLFQHPSWNGETISKSLHLSIGDYAHHREEIPHGALELMEMTARRQGLFLDKENWTFSGDVWRRRHDGESICEKTYRGNVAV